MNLNVSKLAFISSEKIFLQSNVRAAELKVFIFVSFNNLSDTLVCSLLPMLSSGLNNTKHGVRSVKSNEMAQLYNVSVLLY